MQVDQQAALTKRFEATAEDIRSLLRDNRIRYSSVERRPPAAPWSPSSAPGRTWRRRAA